MGDSPKTKKQKLGIFENLSIQNSADGFKYYIARNGLPENTGTVSLVVRAGFLLEDDREAGFAHLLEHVLLRSVTESRVSRLAQSIYSHELHETSQRYTIYSFRVHEKSEFLDAIEMLKLIAQQKVIITENQVELEKKLVAIEYLTKLDAYGAANSFQSQLFQTSTLDTCKKNLAKINSSELTKYYHTSYIPSQMAFIVTGNLDTKLLIKECCSVETPSMDMDYVPRAVLAQRWTFEIKILNDSKIGNSLVFKLQRPSNLLQYVVIKMLLSATTHRLSASGGGEACSIWEGMNLFIVFRNCDLKRVVYEVWRLKQLGLSLPEIEREFNLIKREMRRDAELFRLDEHHQIDVLQNELRNLFLFDIPITSPDYEFQVLAKKTPDSLQGLADDFLELLKFEEARLYVGNSSFNLYANLIHEVQMQDLHPWEDVRELPEFTRFEEHWSCEDVDPCSRTNYDKSGMREFRFKNGMRILLCKSDIPPFACSIKGFAHGGLSECDDEDYISCFFGVRIVEQFSTFPLNFLLCGGEKLDIKLVIDDYSRNFEAVFDVSDLEVILQYVYLLFYKKPQPDQESDPGGLVSMALDQWMEERMPWETAYRIATGHRAPSDSDLAGVDYEKATNFVSSCFSDPAHFTVVLAGDFDMDATGNLVRKYMGSIPCVSSPNLPTDRNGITSVPINFPRDIEKRVTYAEQTFKDVYICLPLKMDKQKQEEDRAYMGFLKQIVIQKLFQVLRQEMGEVYSIEGSIFFDGKQHYSPQSDEAVLIITFAYVADGDVGSELVEKALKSIEKLQYALSEEDIAGLPFSAGPSTVRSITVLDEAVDSYQSNKYTGDLEKTLIARADFVRSIPIQDVNFWKRVFHRIMPDKCSERFVSVVFHDKVNIYKDMDKSVLDEEEDEEESVSDEEEDEEESVSDEEELVLNEGELVFDEEDSDEDDSQKLSFVNQGLSVVPPEVCESTEIKTLNLSRNSIKELPLTLSACSSLEVLILSDNKINDWPADALTSLPTLTCLQLNNNPLNRIPSNGFEAVSRLKVLNLNDCVDSLLDNPSFASLPRLRELHLRGVNMQEVPSDIVLLRKLQILDLGRNSLSTIPQGFQNLTSMYELDLSENRIETLPPELGLSGSLTMLLLEGNPLSSFPETIRNGRTEEVLKHLRDSI